MENLKKRDNIQMVREMFDGARIVAVIPARGGSRRLPRKNLLPLNGRPMIEWTVRAALESKWVDTVVVSTDDKEIARVSLAAGAEVPFLRPAHLATDEARSIDVFGHATRFLKEEGRRFEYGLLLQPTSPLRSDKHIDGAIEFLFQESADAVIGVTVVSHPIEWVDELPENYSMDNFCRNVPLQRSQNAPTRYLINGAIYLGDIDKLIEADKFLLDKRCFGFAMDSSVSIDIDTEQDLIIAEALIASGVA